MRSSCITGDSCPRSDAVVSLCTFIEDLGTRPSVVAQPEPGAVPLPPCRVRCLPVRADRDELAGTMLAQLLPQQGTEASIAPGKLVAGELLALLETAKADVVCVSVVEPSTVIQARCLCLKVRAQCPRLKIVIGLWNAGEGASEAVKRLRDSGADEVVFSLAEAVAQITKLAPLSAENA